MPIFPPQGSSRVSSTNWILGSNEATFAAHTAWTIPLAKYGVGV